MTIDRGHFSLTLSLGVVLAGILCCVGRRRLADSWRWRGLISFVIAAGVAPTIFRSQPGSFAHGFLTPATFVLVTAVHDMLLRPSQISLRDFEALCLFILLPIILIAVVVFFAWSAIESRPRHHEHRGT